MSLRLNGCVRTNPAIRHSDEVIEIIFNYSNVPIVLDIGMREESTEFA